MTAPLIAPSILSANFSDLAGEVKALMTCDWFHLDVMDGHFVPNLTFGAGLIKSLRPLTKKIFDVHLMIDYADDYVKSFADAGADQITIHYEASHYKNTAPSLASTQKVLEKIKSLSKKAGVAIKPNTPLATIAELKKIIDLVIVMSVEPGFGGQGFISTSLEKITTASQWVKGTNIMVEVDGGVNGDNRQSIVESFIKGGAPVHQLSLVAGHYVMGDGDKKLYGVRIARLKHG